MTPLPPLKHNNALIACQAKSLSVHLAHSASAVFQRARNKFSSLSQEIISTMSERINETFQLKGGLYTFTTLQLQSADLPMFEAQLSDKLKQAPKFFNHAPIILDLQKVNSSAPSNEGAVDFLELKQLLVRLGLIPVGVKGVTPKQKEGALSAGFALLQESKTTDASTDAAALQAKTHPTSPLPQAASLIIKTPVRSGQQIYAKGGDLIILASVSHGAEILADGNIHVYGTLRGRALAGIMGDTRAHIFCQCLEAELLSIAGRYKMSEDIERAAWRIPAMASLTEDHLSICPLPA